MRTVFGKGSLEDPVRGEDPLRVEQSNYYEQVLENSMATSKERLEQLRRVGCRPTRRMAHSNRIHSRSERLDSSSSITFQKHRPREEPSKFRAADCLERNDHAKRVDEVLVELFNASRSMKVMGVNLRVQNESNMRCDKPSVTIFISSTEVLL